MDYNIGELIEGNFEENTITIKVSGDMVVRSGSYAVVPFEDFQKLVEKSNVIPNVSQRSELLLFITWVGKNTPSYSLMRAKQIVDNYLKSNCD